MPSPKSMAVIERALAWDSDECFLWPSGWSGYPTVSENGKHLRVHRFICKMVYGGPPTPRHEVAHSCHRRRCINRRHLRWATHAENHRDPRWT